MTDDDLAALFDLLHLRGISPNRSRWLTDGRSPSDVMERLRSGRLPSDLGEAPRGVNDDLVRGWIAGARDSSGHDRLARHRAAGVDLLWPGHELWPFADDPDPPSLLFAWGDLGLLAGGSAVGIVGTRRCTTVGRRVARRLGADLAAPRQGVPPITIVSGLAAGIDAEAHDGALAAAGRVIGVVACGLDRPYPKHNRHLWKSVAERGLLLSESPLGAAPERWKFPARNRLIAALSDVVVVVESHAAGGALSTADEAASRGVTVGAVPGSVLSSASEGTNALLVDGCPPIRSADDVLGHLGLPLFASVDSEARASAGSADERASGRRQSTPSRAASVLPSGLVGLERTIGEAALAGPVHLDQLLLSIDAERAEILAAAQRLVHGGVLAMEGAKLTLSIEQGDD